MANNSRTRAPRCGICGKTGLLTRRVTRSYGRGNRLLVIENVPILACPHCGESYVTADTLHEIEQIKFHRRRMTTPRRVAVASFRPASHRRAG
ncbi:MAG: type II toxin-antitoxin system MqsA family antitoxin [Acidobacteria bacterium]|nr:type II toxin-antitoxin system MqsA family antitoxin [Acidobacteriota bacterium]